MSENNTVYIIAGPTAVGKSQIAYELAQRIDGEIINCDSIQLYNYMDIGSAKPSKQEIMTVPHHLYSIVDPDYNMTVATYQKLALAVIDDVLSRGKVPIICGGTGLYLNSLLYDMDFARNQGNLERRLELEQMAEENDNEYMHHYLAAIDPDAAERIHPNNLRKIIRAIEVYECGYSIKSLSECPINPKYDFKFFSFVMSKQYLYERINNRVVSLIENGLEDEVRSLLNMGYDSSTPALKGIGYKEMIEYIEGRVTLEEAITNIMTNTRHYAKRQLTWLNRYGFDIRFEITPEDNLDSKLNFILNN
ncbi:MAG: tRNA (adenosine(37)-N6)-dimethylallyltransferase MiaA [Clostridiales bacterium]|nr:tRNA (adenosine(37)-N6)-dimethylallyltransferase MiaA [Clostridiales bacterium]